MSILITQFCLIFGKRICALFAYRFVQFVLIYYLTFFVSLCHKCISRVFYGVLIWSHSSLSSDRCLSKKSEHPRNFHASLLLYHHPPPQCLSHFWHSYCIPHVRFGYVYSIVRLVCHKKTFRSNVICLLMCPFLCKFTPSAFSHHNFSDPL